MASRKTYSTEARHTAKLEIRLARSIRTRSKRSRRAGLILSDAVSNCNRHIQELRKIKRNDVNLAKWATGELWLMLAARNCIRDIADRLRSI